MAPLTSVTPVPSVSLVFNLAVPTETKTSQAQDFASQLQQLGLPATWAIRRPQQAKCLSNALLTTTPQELAFIADACSPQRLRSELASHQAELQNLFGQNCSVVMGDPQALRARTALLADQGITAVVAVAPPSRQAAHPPRQLPCGLWQLEPTHSLPRPRSRWALLPARHLAMPQLLKSRTAAQPAVIAIAPEQLSSRNLKNCEDLLRAISAAQRGQELTVVTISALAAQLASQHAVKPQRSILRRAA